MTVPLVSSALELGSAFVLMQTSNCQPHTGEVDDDDDDDDIYGKKFQNVENEEKMK